MPGLGSDSLQPCTLLVALSKQFSDYEKRIDAVKNVAI